MDQDIQYMGSGDSTVGVLDYLLESLRFKA